MWAPPRKRVPSCASANRLLLSADLRWADLHDDASALRGAYGPVVADPLTAWLQRRLSLPLKEPGRRPQADGMNSSSPCCSRSNVRNW